MTCIIKHNPNLKKTMQGTIALMRRKLFNIGGGGGGVKPSEVNFNTWGVLQSEHTPGRSEEGKFFFIFLLAKCYLKLHTYKFYTHASLKSKQWVSIYMKPNV